MITKEEFAKYIESYQEFEQAMDRLETAIAGRKYVCNLFESDWYGAVARMLDIFIDSHFTDDGQDLIDWWLFEDVDHIITQKVESDLFTEDRKIEYDVNSIDDLWDYLMLYKEDYLKDA